MILVHKGKTLSDSHTIKKERIEGNDGIYLIKKADEAEDKIKIRIKLSETYLKVKVFEKDITIEEIIRMICKEDGIDYSCGGISLSYKGQRLSKEETLRSAGIENQDILIMTASLRDC